MEPQWPGSSSKHGVPRPDQVFVIVHATYTGVLPDQSDDDGEVRLYIGPPHAQALPEMEILVNVYADGREARIFHAMDLGPKYRRHRQENPHD